MTHRRIILLLMLSIMLAACSPDLDEQATEIAAAVIATQTAVAPDPTDAPTETPTAEPTETPTPEPTDTPTPTADPTDTPTPEPTDTPIPTDTPTPLPTDTPSPTATATETPTPRPTVPPQPTATPTAEELDEIVIYYISNPNDVLGVFPVRNFDANDLYNNMVRIRSSLQTMRANIDATAHDANACNAYAGAYNNILYSGVFYEEVPPDWQDIDYAYYISFVYSLDRTRPAYLSCVNAGKVDDFNLGLARQTLDETMSYFFPYVDAAASRL